MGSTRVILNPNPVRVYVRIRKSRICTPSVWRFVFVRFITLYTPSDRFSPWVNLQSNSRMVDVIALCPSTDVQVLPWVDNHR